MLNILLRIRNLLMQKWFASSFMIWQCWVINSFHRMKWQNLYREAMMCWWCLQNNVQWFCGLLSVGESRSSFVKNYDSPGKVSKHGEKTWREQPGLSFLVLLYWQMAYKFLSLICWYFNNCIWFLFISDNISEKLSMS